MLTRRCFITAIGAVAAPGMLRAQDVPAGDSVVQTMFGPMDEGAYRAVRRAPKEGAAAALTRGQSDALERTLKCQCGCTLDVYTCRTTDFTCPVSPAMHRDVLALAEGGYGAPEIRTAFVDTYGEQVLMAPVRAGFNWVGYVLPFAAMGAGIAFVVWLTRKWSRRRAVVAADAAGSNRAAVSAEELAEIDAAVRRDE
jgi:cytochrome c-type biogenesis protein CcmH